MKSKEFYVTPELYQEELEQEGVLCSSSRDGQLDPLEEKYDWSSSMWN